MNSLLHDLRCAGRTLRRQPLVTAVAALSLSLGVGANGVIFSLVNAILLRPLPVQDPGRLVRIGRTSDGDGFLPVSHPEYLTLRDRIAALEGLAAHQPNTVILNVDGEPRQELMEIVSANYFSLLGLTPSRGRGFLPSEDLVPEGAPVIVISDALWRRRFGADASVVGRSVNLNGHPFTVAGVAPEGFSGTFAGFDVALWVPVMMHAQVMPTEPDLAERDYRFLMLIGRIAPEANTVGLASQLSVVAAALEAERTEERDRLGFTVHEATGVHPLLGGLIRGFLVLLMAVVGLLLLIACANVANLLLARAVQRRREIAVRMSLGAERRHILRQLLTESVALALLGGAGGIAFAYWASGLLSAFRPPVGMPIALDVSLDWRVLLFCLLVASGTAVLFGLAPALQGSRVDLTTALRRTPSSGLGRRGGWRSALVVGQVSVSALLLVGAALLLQSLRNSRVLDPGFDSRNMLVIDMDPGTLGVSESEGRALWEALVTRIEALPGVRAATLALMVPLGDRGDAVEVAAASGGSEEETRQLMGYNMVRSGYFNAMGVPLVRGRDFGSTDGADSPGAAIINETLERRFWPGEDAVGRRVNMWDRGGQLRELTVVGVARDTKYRSLAEGPTPFVYLPLTQWYRHDLRAHVRAAGDPAALIPVLRQQVRDLHPELPAGITTLDQEMAFSLVPIRVAGAVLVSAGGIGIFLVAIGLFGLIAHAVAQRTREFGIRMAIGAGRGVVERMVLLQGLRLTGLGLVIGLALASLATQVLRGLLYGVSPTDPVTFAGVIVVFIAVSALASMLPARRATRVNPAVVLREE